MSIAEMIRRPAETLPPSASCVAAAAMMRDQRVGSIVVAEGGTPLGIVTDRDLALRVLAEGRDAGQLPIREVMSAYPIYLTSDKSVDDALRTMREMGLRRIPIVDRQGRLEGMLSLDDLLVRLGEQLGRLSEVVAIGLSPLR